MALVLMNRGLETGAEGLSWRAVEDLVLRVPVPKWLGDVTVERITGDGAAAQTHSIENGVLHIKLESLELTALITVRPVTK
jgi:hypothetical protein